MNIVFSRKVVLVAGGTGGLGRSVAIRFLEEGAKVIVMYRREEGFLELQRIAGQYEPSLEGHQVDVADESAVGSFVRATVARHGGVDALVNTVGGYAGIVKLWDLDTKVFDQMLELNLRSGCVLARAVLPSMLKAGSGSIVNVAAKAAIDHGAGAAAYAASKAAVLALMDSLAADTKGTGIRVNSILPSIMDTAANRKAMPGATYATWPKPDQIADVILFLSSNSPDRSMARRSRSAVTTEFCGCLRWSLPMKSAMVKLFLAVFVAVFGFGSQPGVAQQTPQMTSTDLRPSASGNSAQTARILGMDPLLAKLTSLRAQRACDAPATIEELATRQELLEVVQKATLDVDGVLAEIANEQGQLSNLRTSLQARRDTTVARLNTAALITGSGAGAAVSATQFTALGGRTNNIGDGVGVGAGVASTILSVIATRKQNGPSATVGSIPNMLAPLFTEQPVLDTYYPPSVLRYLQTIPANEDASRGTRLEQLKAMWADSGRLDRSGPKRQADIAALTSSSNPVVRVSIQDLSTRIAMLLDVSGRVSLMKRDLSALMQSSTTGLSKCSKE